MKKLTFLFATMLASVAMLANSVTYTFTNKAWSTAESAFTSVEDGNGFSNGGVQVYAKDDTKTPPRSGQASAVSVNDFANVTKVTVAYRTNQSKGQGNILVGVGSSTPVEQAVTIGSDGSIVRDMVFDFSETKPSGKVTVGVSNCTENSIYVISVTIENESTDPYLGAAPVEIDFGEVYEGDDVEAKSVAVTAENLTGDITVTVSDPVFTATPATLSESGEVMVALNTAAIGQYNANLTLSAEGVESVVVALKASVIAKPAMKSFRKVTEPADLYDGVKLLISNSSENYLNVAGAYESGNNVKAMLATANGDNIEVLDDSKAIYTLEVNPQDPDQYYLRDANGKYLYAASTSANQMKAQSEEYAWNISIDDVTYEATITAVENTSRGLMRYNPNNIYSCYASTSTIGTLPVLYVEDVAAVKYKVEIAEGLVNGSIAAVADQREGATVKLNITPDEGYVVDMVIVMQGENVIPMLEDGLSFVMPNGDVTVSATFKEVEKYDIVVSAGENGTIAVVGGIDKAAAGTMIQVIITPNDGYEIDEILAGDVELQPIVGGDANYQFEMPQGNVNISVTFKEIVVATEYSIIINDAANGIVTAVPASAPAGTEVQLIVIANDGYQLKSISAVAGEYPLSLTENDGDYYFTMPAADVTVTAEFEEEEIIETAISLTQFLADKPETEVLLKDLIVLYASGKNTYVIDEDGVALVIYDSKNTYYDGILNAGELLKGQKATYTVYNNQSEIIPTNTATIMDGEQVAPLLYTVMPTVADENKFVRLENIEIAKADDNKYYAYDGELQLYGGSNAIAVKEDGIYNVEGIIINFKGTQLELITMSAPEKVGDIDTALEDVEALDVNAPMYNTLGQKVNADYKGIVIQNGKKYILK